MADTTQPVTAARPVGEPLLAAVKMAANGLCLAVMALPAALCRAEARLSGRSDLFAGLSQLAGLMPGLPGKYLRRAFYRMTLDACAFDCDIGFLATFSSARVAIGRGAYIGPMAMIGDASIGDGALIGTRVSILSGAAQHDLGADGLLTPFDPARAGRVSVGRNTWIGEGAILMADVGDRCIVAAGAVVATPVPSGCVVGGNPARFIRRLDPAGPLP